MGDFVVGGLPVHILVVHVVVVFVPLAALSLALSAVWPAARRRLGLATPILAAIAFASGLVARASGEWLLARVPSAPLIEQHAMLGETLWPWTLAVLVLAVGQYAWHRFERRIRMDATRKLSVSIAIAALSIAAGFASVVQVYLVGDSGARAVWEGSFSDEPLE